MAKRISKLAKKNSKMAKGISKLAKNDSKIAKRISELAKNNSQAMINSRITFTINLFTT